MAIVKLECAQDGYQPNVEFKVRDTASISTFRVVLNPPRISPDSPDRNVAEAGMRILQLSF